MPVLETPTEEQIAIIDYVHAGKGHLLVEALAGTGKTTSLLAALEVLPQRSALFCAFNKRIAEELDGKVKAVTPKGCGVHVKTFHAQGLAWLSQYFPGLQIDSSETENLINRVAGQAIGFQMRRAAVRLLRTLKETCIDASPSAAKVLALGYEYDLFDKLADQAIDLTVEVVRDAYLVGKDFANREAIDFCDMVWGPTVLGLKPKTRYQAIFADEFQDISEPQLAMIEALLVPDKGRLIAVGDARQQVYQFRGSMGSRAWAYVRAKYKAQTLPLTTTWRCSKAVVETARAIVPELRWRPDAPTGMVQECAWSGLAYAITGSSQPPNQYGSIAKLGGNNTFVLSRNNASLLDCALWLWSQRVIFQLNAGEELLEPLLTILDKLDKSSKHVFTGAIAKWRAAELARAEKANAAAYADQVEERATMLTTAAGYAEPAEIPGLLRSILKPSSQGVLLSTVHKVKGLEADRVFLLKQSFARHDDRKCYTCAGTGNRNSSVVGSKDKCDNCGGSGRWAMADEEELNIEYVAITRAKTRLVWVDMRAREVPDRRVSTESIKMVMRGESKSVQEAQLALDMRTTLGIVSERDQLIDGASRFPSGITRKVAEAFVDGAGKHHSIESTIDVIDEGGDHTTDAIATTIDAVDHDYEPETSFVKDASEIDGFEPPPITNSVKLISNTVAPKVAKMASTALETIIIGDSSLQARPDTESSKESPWTTSVREALANEQIEPEKSKLTVATIRKRKKVDTIYTDASCTPAYIADLLPEWDIDPCSNPLSRIRSRWSYSLEKFLDGTKLPWRGSAFLNWPYSGPLVWALKATREMIEKRCTELVVLCKLDTSTTWWHEITAPILGPIDLWLLDERVQYDEHPEVIRSRQLERLDAGKPAGDGLSSNNFCSCIIHHRGDREPLKLETIATLWNRA